VSEPQPARRYNYWLGGTLHGAADRASGDAIAAAFPATLTAARENRRFLGRVVRFLSEAGVEQFLDIGAGLPAPGGVLEFAPNAKLLAVDNDPLVGEHTSGPFRCQDLRHPDKILAGAREVLDFDRPIGLLIVSVLHFLEDADDPYGHVATLVDALPSGSYLALSHGTVDHQTPEQLAAMARIIRTTPGQFRTHDEVARFFSGLELVEPGIVSVAEWRAKDGPSAAETEMYGAVARKP
jgi:hypothetical protein